LTGPSTVAPFLRSRRRKRLDAEHGIYQINPFKPKFNLQPCYQLETTA
jgi:hypothetical protein